MDDRFNKLRSKYSFKRVSKEDLTTNIQSFDSNKLENYLNKLENEKQILIEVNQDRSLLDEKITFLESLDDKYCNKIKDQSKRLLQITENLSEICSENKIIKGKQNKYNKLLEKKMVKELVQDIDTINKYCSFIEDFLEK